MELMVTFTHSTNWITCIDNYKLLQIPGIVCGTSSCILSIMDNLRVFPVDSVKGSPVHLIKSLYHT